MREQERFVCKSYNLFSSSILWSSAPFENQENSKIERRKLEIEYEVFLGHSIFQREGTITRTVKVCIAYKTLLRLDLTDWLCYRTSSVATLCFNFLTLGCIHNVYCRGEQRIFFKGANVFNMPQIIQNFLRTPPLGQKIPLSVENILSLPTPPTCGIHNERSLSAFMVSRSAFKQS